MKQAARVGFWRRRTRDYDRLPQKKNEFLFPFTRKFQCLWSPPPPLFTSNKIAAGPWILFIFRLSSYNSRNSISLLETPETGLNFVHTSFLRPFLFQLVQNTQQCPQKGRRGERSREKSSICSSGRSSWSTFLELQVLWWASRGFPNCRINAELSSPFCCLRRRTRSIIWP